MSASGGEETVRIANAAWRCWAVVGDGERDPRRDWPHVPCCDMSARGHRLRPRVGGAGLIRSLTTWC